MFMNEKKRKKNEDKEENLNIDDFFNMNIGESDNDVDSETKSTSSEVEEYFGLEDKNRTIKQNLLQPQKQIKTKHLVLMVWGK